MVEGFRVIVKSFKDIWGEMFMILIPDEKQRSVYKASIEPHLRSGQTLMFAHGIPWGVKDLFATAGIPTQWGSPAYEGQVFNYDATVVSKLAEAGGVLIGKLASGELASGSRWFGRTTRCP